MSGNKVNINEFKDMCVVTLLVTKAKSLKISVRNTLKIIYTGSRISYKLAMTFKIDYFGNYVSGGVLGLLTIFEAWPHLPRISL